MTKGTVNLRIFFLVLTVCKLLFSNLNLDIKESVKETATDAKDYVKDTGSKAADKGRGKNSLLYTGVNMFS